MAVGGGNRNLGGQLKFHQIKIFLFWLLLEQKNTKCVFLEEVGVKLYSSKTQMANKNMFCPFLSDRGCVAFVQ